MGSEMCIRDRGGDEQHHKWSSFRHRCSASTMLQVDYSSQVICTNVTCISVVLSLLLNESNQREHSCILGRNASLKLKSLFVPLCQSMCDWCQDPLTTSLVVRELVEVCSVAPICRPSLHGKFKLLRPCFQSFMPLTSDIVLCIIPRHCLT